MSMPKRRRLNEAGHDPGKEDSSASMGTHDASAAASAPISPPRLRRANCEVEQVVVTPPGIHGMHAEAAVTEQSRQLPTPSHCQPIRSPVQLTRISDLSPTDNVDTVGIRDILGDPLIKECWAFNYCFDVDWLMGNFDEDVRDQIRVVLVHGSWRKDSPTRIRIEQSLTRFANVRAITAYMPDPFGTHHTKMFILLRHDDTAQVVISTANLLPQDWRMCQAVWRSPLLPKAKIAVLYSANKVAPEFGTGLRFQFDLISYFNAYGGKLHELRKTLCAYDFSSVKACLIASVPSRIKPATLDMKKQTLWGWPALDRSVSQIPGLGANDGFMVAQVSSIATLGVTPNWLHGTLHRAMQGKALGKLCTDNARLSIIFPTPDEVRRTIDGYACGASIHTKLHTAANKKQLEYLMPHMCHWAGGDNEGQRMGSPPVRQAGRRRAGPHIKTYLRFADAAMTKLDWAMVTSANLSKQAWGTEDSGVAKEVRISSFEIGVLFWPDMWREDEKAAQMIPTFKSDTPKTTDTPGQLTHQPLSGLLIGWRMPYDLPLVPYRKEEEPWCATKPHLQPDWRGNIWAG